MKLEIEDELPHRFRNNGEVWNFYDGAREGWFMHEDTPFYYYAVLDGKCWLWVYIETTLDEISIVEEDFDAAGVPQFFYDREEGRECHVIVTDNDWNVLTSVGVDKCVPGNVDFMLSFGNQIREIMEEDD